MGRRAQFDWSRGPICDRREAPNLFLLCSRLRHHSVPLGGKAGRQELCHQEMEALLEDC